MAIEPQLLALALRPETLYRLRVLSKEILEMLGERTATPEQALIVLDGVMRQVRAASGLALLSPIPYTNTGHA